MVQTWDQYKERAVRYHLKVEDFPQSKNVHNQKIAPELKMMKKIERKIKAPTRFGF